MFSKKKKAAVYSWIKETHFIRMVVKKLQEVVDKSEYDIRLVYKPVFSFPAKYWKIVLELSDGKFPVSASDIDDMEGELLEALERSPAFAAAERTLFWLTPGNRNSCTTVSISYVVSSYCEECGKPGIIIYWNRGNGG